MTRILIAAAIPLALALVGVVWSARIRRRPEPEPECGHVGCAPGVCVERESETHDALMAQLRDVREARAETLTPLHRADIAAFRPRIVVERRRCGICCKPVDGDGPHPECRARVDAIKAQLVAREDLLATRQTRKASKRAARKAATPKARLTARERRGRGARREGGGV